MEDWAEIRSFHELRCPRFIRSALSGDGVVGVVLNTIDDALDHGREGDRTLWRLTDITYLPELLDAARSYARPVVLVADHGHVLERSPAGEGPVVVTGVESARWRTGTPEPGEVELAGPRVLYGNGRIVAPWREEIRYTPRKSGYHGGASLAEMTVPVLVLLPSQDLLPSDWLVLPIESIAPQWWAQQRSTDPVIAVRPPPVKRSSRGKASRPVECSEPLFAMDEVVPVVAVETLGSLVVGTEIYASQRAFVRKGPDKNDVAVVIDALAAADGTLSLTAAAAKAGRAGRNPEGFAATLQRLFNVEGYPVVSVIDGGRTLSLDVGLLREQFGLGVS